LELSEKIMALGGTIRQVEKDVEAIWWIRLNSEIFKWKRRLLREKDLTDFVAADIG
jgi:hypothetical protein